MIVSDVGLFATMEVAVGERGNVLGNGPVENVGGVTDDAIRVYDVIEVAVSGTVGILRDSLNTSYSTDSSST